MIDKVNDSDIIKFYFLFVNNIALADIYDRISFKDKYGDLLICLIV